MEEQLKILYDWEVEVDTEQWKYYLLTEGQRILLKRLEVDGEGLVANTKEGVFRLSVPPPP